MNETGADFAAILEEARSIFGNVSANLEATKAINDVCCPASLWMRIWQLEGDEISRQHFLYRALAVKFGCLPAWKASCAAGALLKPCHALQQTQEALMQQRESEQREKLMSFITLSNVMEFSNNELGFTEEEWSELSIRMAELQGMLPLYVIHCIQLTRAVF
jgi:hypothetical protein